MTLTGLLHLQPYPVPETPKSFFSRENLSIGEKAFARRNVKSVVIENLRFADCKTDQRSPIELENSEVTVKNCTFEENDALRGGSVSVLKGSILTIESSSFASNTAVSGGGAIFVGPEASLKVSSSHFKGNAIRSTASEQKRGGAIMAENFDAFVNLSFSDCHFEGNMADYGGAVFLSGVDLGTFDACQFEKNVANQIGGAILVNGSESRAFDSSAHYAVCNIANSIFSGNKAEYGGAVGILSGSSGIFTNSDMTMNEAISGGAMYLFNDTSVIVNGTNFMENSADQFGGAVYLHHSEASPLLKTDFPVSTAAFHMIAGECVRNQAQFGGCIAAINETTLSVTNSTLIGNTVGGLGGLGGAIYASKAHSLDLRQTVFKENIAFGGGGGGIFVQSSWIIEDDFFVGNGSSTMVQITNCSFMSNQANGGGVGGGICGIGAINMKLQNSYFDQNFAESSGAGIALFSERYENDGNMRHLPFLTSEGHFSDNFRLLKETASSFGIELNPLIQDFVPILSVEMSSTTFEKNKALEGGGGGLEANWGCFVNARDVNFLHNNASFAAAVSMNKSVLFCEQCQISHNTAAYSAGGISISGSLDNGRDVIPAAGFIKDSLFLNNTSGLFGGGIYLKGLEASLYITSNTTFQNNTAFGGGAISSQLAHVISIADSTFYNNTAFVGGGAIAIQFIQLEENQAFLFNLSFHENHALYGGALHASYDVHPSDHATDRVEYNGVLVTPSLTARNTSFINNTVDYDGGAIHFRGVPALFENLTVNDNRAGAQGGGLLMTEGCIVKILGMQMSRNVARDGGGCMLRADTITRCFDCYFEDNVAEELGGAVCLLTHLYRPRIAPNQFDRSVFSGNGATLGGIFVPRTSRYASLSLGAIYIGQPSENESGLPVEPAITSFRGTKFVNNVAIIAGGAMMFALPVRAGYFCTYDANIKNREQLEISDTYLLAVDTEYYISITQEKSFVCESSEKNRVENGGYGPLLASYATSTRIIHGNDRNSTQDLVRVKRNQRNPTLEPVQVVLVDYFNQSFAETNFDHPILMATLSTNDKISFSGQVMTTFKRGQASFEDIIVKGPAGIYNLTVALSDERIQNVSIMLEILPCPIDWVNTNDGNDCEQCFPGTYNFDLNATRCRDCPDNAECRYWGIQPKRNFYVSYPCYEKPTECLTKAACDYGEREIKFKKFFETNEPNCNLSTMDLAAFRNVGCSTGHTGWLCGSCMEDYEKRGFSCHKCRPFWLSLGLFFIPFFWFIFIIWAGIKRNLSDTFQNQPSNVLANSNEAVQDPNIMANNDDFHVPRNIPSRHHRGALASRSFPISLELLTQANEKQWYTSLMAHDDATNLHAMPICMNPEISREELFKTRSDKTMDRSFHAGKLQESPKPPSENTVPFEVKSDLQNESLDSNKKEKAKERVFECFKIFLNFAQTCSMALFAQTNWTGSVQYLLRVLDIVGLSSGEFVLSTGCLFSGINDVPRSIFKEIVLIIFPIASLLASTIFWIWKEKKDWTICLRRIILNSVVILSVSYIGLTRRLIQILYCVKSEDDTSDGIQTKLVWAEDTSVKCYTGSHLYLVIFLVIPMLLSVTIAFPLCCAFFLLKIKKAELNYPENDERFGFMYRGYRDDCVYWDCFIMLRKVMLALVIAFGYPLGGRLQFAIVLFLLIAFALIQLRAHPFSQESSFLNNLEVSSLCVTIVTFIIGMTIDEESQGPWIHAFASSVVIAFVLLFVFCTLGCTAASILDMWHRDFENDNIEEEAERVNSEYENP